MSVVHYWFFLLLILYYCISYWKQEAILVAYTRAREVQGIWPVIISWIVHQPFMVCCNFSDLFWYIIRLWNKEKKQKKTLLLIITSRRKKKGKKRKKEKSSICVHWESNPGQSGVQRANHSAIDAYGLDTWPGQKRMRMRLAYLSATPTKAKKKKRKRRNLNSAPSARVNTRHHCCTCKNQRTGAYLSLMAAGLQRGAHNHCLNNLLPEKRIQKKPQIDFFQCGQNIYH